MFIYTKIWIKNDFFKLISKNVVLVDMLIFSDIHMGRKRFLKVISKQRPLSRNVDIFRHMDKKQFFQSDLKKSTFSLNIDIFGDMGKKKT